MGSGLELNENSSLDTLSLRWVRKADGPMDLKLRPDLGVGQTDLGVTGIQMTIRTLEATWGDSFPVREENNGQSLRTNNTVLLYSTGNCINHNGKEYKI